MPVVLSTDHVQRQGCLPGFTTVNGTPFKLQECPVTFVQVSDAGLSSESTSYSSGSISLITSDKSVHHRYNFSFSHLAIVICRNT